MTLRPCPFCGGKARSRKVLVGMLQHPRYDVECRDCECRTRPYKREHDAIFRWNARKDRPMNQALDKRGEPAII
jgi:Lar family restriction alleviation protein